MTDLPTNASALSKPLTAREQEILACLAEGLSNQEIAGKLYLAEKTVRWYNTQIYQKLGVKGRKEAVARAGEMGLLAALTAGVSVPDLKSRLPHQTTPFVGRQRELEKIIQLLDDTNNRLVTILASGGMGKTRLSLEVAKSQLSRYPDGVFFVPLEPLGEVSQVILAIAEQIGFNFHGDEAPDRQLLSFMRDRSLLLVLDNFEHLLAGAVYVDEILRAAPGVRILATSRERLGLQIEVVFILRGMDFPILDASSSLGDYDAFHLFVQVARRARPDLTLQPGDLADLVRICRLTAGMPLALELAAGWLDTLSLSHIADELQRGIDLLETDFRDVEERHRSIRATFEGTWQSLSKVNRRVFMCLSVFRGGFNLSAARAVVDANPQILRRLGHKALVEALPDGRFFIHELLRQFGAEKLAQSTEAGITNARHAQYFAGFMRDCQREIYAPGQLTAVARIDADFENVRQAWMYVLKQQDWEVLGRFLDSLRFYCEVRTRTQEGLDLFEQAERVIHDVEGNHEIDFFRGRLLARLGWFYFDTGWVQKSITASEEAIRLLRLNDQPLDLLAALFNRHLVAITRGQLETAVALLHECLHMARELSHSNWEGRILVWMAIAKIVSEEYHSARSLAEESLAVFERMGGDRWSVMRPYSVLGDIEELLKNDQKARQYFHKSLAISETFGHKLTIGANKTHLARIAFREGQADLANQLLREALQAFWDAGYLWAAPFPLIFKAQMLADQGDALQAVEILATVDRYLISFRRMDKDARALRSELAACLDPEQMSAAWAHGLQRELRSLVNSIIH